VTSRERIISAMRHSKSDRVPINLGGMRSTGIHAAAYRRVCDFLGFIELSVKVFDVHQMLAHVDECVRKEIHSDVIE